MRPIDADALMDALDRHCDAVCVYSKKQRDVMCGACALGTAFDVIDEQPTIDPVKRGRWVMQGTAYGCSLCGEGVIHPFHNYCPNCGARMEGRDDDSDKD